MNNKMSLKFLAVSQNEAFARNVVAAFCVPLNPTIEWINDVKTSVSEAVTNCIVHAFPDEAGFVTIDAEIVDDTVHIDVIDNGIGIADVSLAIEPCYTTKPDDERSGMGFTVMQTFMDSLEVKSSAEHGTTITMSKRVCTR